MVVCVLSKAGNQLPSMPFREMVGKGAKVAPEQIVGIGSNVGVITVATSTSMVNVVIVPHWPAFGVKVYVVVCILFKAGDQLPSIPFCEVVGKGAKVAPGQIVGTGSNVGVTIASTRMIKVVVVAHWPAFGANV